MAEIKEGCIATLASDGIYAPRMTVGKITDGEAKCFWFRDKELKVVHIPVAALRATQE